MYSYRVEQAIRAATILHKDQARKGIPYPYVSHPVAMAFLLTDYTDDEDVIISALLHDTLEDTPYTTDELERDFGPRVRDIVEGVTHVAFGQGKDLSSKELAERYIQALERAPRESLLVSIADKIHNMRSTVETYLDRPDDFLKDFTEKLEDRRAKYERLRLYFNDHLEHAILKEFNAVHDEYRAFLDRLEALTPVTYDKKANKKKGKG